MSFWEAKSSLAIIRNPCDQKRAPGVHPGTEKVSISKFEVIHVI